MRYFFKRKPFRLTRFAGFCGILIPIVIFTSLGLSLVSSPWFNWTQHALSDLGIQEKTATVFNNSLILGGILALLFSLGLIKMLSNKIGAYFFAGSSLALIGIGVFPETSVVLHLITSVLFFMFLIIALLIIGMTSTKNSCELKGGIVALIFGLLAISSLVFLFYFEGVAISEACSCFPAFFWCSIVGIQMIRRQALESDKEE